MSTGPSKAVNNLAFAALALINSIWIFSIYLSTTYMGQFQPASLSRMLEGTAKRPYAYRILVPSIARVTAPLVPPLLAKFYTSAPSPLKDVFKWFSSGVYPREAAVVLTLMFLALLLFPFAARVFLFDLKFPPGYASLLALVMQILILPINLFVGFYYDLPQLLLITLCLIYLHRGNWPIYLLLFATICLNKETSLFLVAIYSIYYWTRLPRGRYLTYLLLQLAIFGIIRLITVYSFLGNPGSSIFWTVPTQIKKYMEHPSAIVFTFLYVCTVIYLVLRHWKYKHPFLRASAVFPAIILLLFLTSGYPMEFRVFLEALPILAALVFHPMDRHVAVHDLET